MKKSYIALLLTTLLFSCQNNAQNNTSVMASSTTNTMAKETIYQFKVTDLYGEAFDFSSLKGKKILVVNTASKCGLTPQYEQLQAIDDKY